MDNHQYTIISAPAVVRTFIFDTWYRLSDDGITYIFKSETTGAVKFFDSAAEREVFVKALIWRKSHAQAMTRRSSNETASQRMSSQMMQRTGTTNPLRAHDVLMQQYLAGK